MDKETLRELVKRETKKVGEDFDFFNQGSEDSKINDHENQARPGMPLFSRTQVQDTLRRTSQPKLKDELKNLLKEVYWKPYAQIQNDTFQKLNALEKQFPNFSEVIQLCRTNLTLNNLEKPGILKLPPMLLSGPPGVGKTLFMQSLTEVLGTTFYSLDMSKLTSGFVIGGGTSTWADSKPGFISDSLRKSTFANPMIMLDEVDKASSGHHYDPLGPFYSLLEEHTAKGFVDEFLEIPMDASGVLWVATANYPELIPDPILSRMQVIEIKKPDIKQARAITQSIYQNLLRDNVWGKHFNPKLGDYVVKELAQFTPRDIRQKLKTALGHAIYRSGGKLRPIIVTQQDIPKASKKKEDRGMGFLAKF